MIAYTDYRIDARVRREAETLASNEFDVVCLTTRNGGKPTRFTLDGVTVQELGVSKYRGKSTVAYALSYLRFLAAASAVCLQRLATRKLDVVHVHNLPDFLVFAGLLPRLAGRKVVLDVHDSVPETFAAKFPSSPLAVRALYLEERLSAAVANRVICVNEPQRETLVGRGIPRSKTFVSMNVPDPRIFGSGHTRIEPVARDDKWSLVYHGTMVDRLGVDLIIKAVARLLPRLPGLELHLWGHGDDLPAFEALAKDLGVGNSVLFKPEGFPLKQLPRQLMPMDIGVVGNRRSAACDLMLPVKLLEYVALNIPAVAPRLRTIQRYFSDDMVGYYEPEDVDSMAEAIYVLCADPQRRRAQAARAAAFLTEHGWERQGAELVNLYDKLVEN